MPEPVRLVSTDPAVEDVFVDLELERGPTGILEPVVYESRRYSFSHRVDDRDGKLRWLEFVNTTPPIAPK